MVLIKLKSGSSLLARYVKGQEGGGLVCAEAHKAIEVPTKGTYVVPGVGSFVARDYIGTIMVPTSDIEVVYFDVRERPVVRLAWPVPFPGAAISAFIKMKAEQAANK